MTSQYPAMSARIDTQRIIQENQPEGLPPPRSVSPRSFGAYDRYVPSRSSTSYRDDYAFRASSWRPSERQPTSYYNRTPSPNRYDSTRAIDDPWTRSPYSSGWPDRRSSDLWGLNRRRNSGTERSFEPSEAWKQNHIEPRDHQDPLPPQSGDRYLPPYSRDSREYNQTPRSHGPDHYSPPSSGDRYRYYPGPYEPRDLFPNSRADSYRPQYEENGQWTHPYSSTARNSRTRTPEDESPRRELRSSYVHRLPLSHTDRESRHYSPGRPVIEISPRGRRSPPVASRPNNFRNLDYLNRVHIGRRSCSPARSFKHEPSPPIPGFIHDTQPTPMSETLPRSSLPIFSPLKRPSLSPPSPVSQLSLLPFKKRPRSTSPEQQSSIASSRRSSPEPILVMEQIPPREAPLDTQSFTQDDIRPPGDAEIAPGISQQTFRRLSVTSPPMSQQRSPSTPARMEASGAVAHHSPPSTSPVPHEHAETATNFASDPCLMPLNIDLKPVQKSPALLHPQSPDLANKEQPSETPQSPSDLLPNIFVADPVEEDIAEAIEIPSQSDEEHLRPEIIHHSTSYDTKSLGEALKHAVMSRYFHDLHRRNERVEPILLSNLSIVERPAINEVRSPDTVMRDVMEGPRMESRQAKFNEIAPLLTKVFEYRRTALSDKVQRLKAEYLELNNNWLEQCAKLDDAAKNLANDDTVATTGRTTRRSAATLGDAVRSDLEMEQIIASLGNEDLTDANHLAMRNAAIIPDLISVTRGQVDHLYDDTNNLIEDASKFYAQRTGIDDWTDDEKQTFIEQYAAYPKQFGIIAESLPNKTTAQCVAFYYLHKKKHIDFRKVVQRYAPSKRRRGGKKTDKQRGNALLADIRKHDAEISSKDPEPSETGPPKKRKPGRPPNVRKTQVELTPATTPTPTATPDPELVPRSRGGRRLNIRAPPIIEEDITEEDEELKPVKRPGRRGRRPKLIKPASSEEPAPISDPQDTTGRRKVNQPADHWPDDERKLFIELVAQHGNDYKRIAASMPKKTTAQVSVFYNANLKKLDLDKVAATAPQRTPSPRPPLPEPTPPPPAPPLKIQRSRDREPETRKVVFEYPGSGIMSPYRSPPPPTPPSNGSIFVSEGLGASSEPSDQGTLAPVGHEGSWHPFNHFRAVMGASSPPAHSANHNYVNSMQHEPYFPSQQIPYNYHHHHPPVIVIPEPEPRNSSGSAIAQGESFYINDYQHTRGPHQTQSSSMGVIPGLVDINVPDFDPQYHQPVIRVQQQDSQQEAPMTSAFMTGRVLLSTKAYSGRP